MDYIIKFLFLILLAVFGLVMNMNLSTHARASQYLKEDLEIAVHDASLFLDQQKLANGQIVFDKVKAENAFKESFNENTGLTDSDYQIIEFKVFDQSNTTFPMNYQAATLKFSDIFTAPTVVAVIETKVKKYFTGASENTIRRVASYSYKINKDELPGQTIDGLLANENGMVWIVPFTQSITSNFDPNRVHPLTGIVRPHNGIDIAAPDITGKPVVAAKEGKVIFAGVINGYGNIVIIDHGNGFETRYAHLSAILVNEGDSVAIAQIIGNVGSTGDVTGPHLHFETRVDGKPYDPLLFYK